MCANLDEERSRDVVECCFSVDSGALTRWAENHINLFIDNEDLEEMVKESKESDALAQRYHIIRYMYCRKKQKFLQDSAKVTIRV